jgi:tRNA dimethylallyltransferase
VKLPELDPGDLLVVVGPTASGKSELALQAGQELGGEIIGADSVQIYRAFDIGSGKPSPDELSRVPHHLIGTLDPKDPIDAAAYARLAEARIEDVRGRGKVPIVCGGTYLWVRALLYGLAKAPPGDPEIRARHAAIAASEGRAALHERLRVVDAESAARLAPNDFVRVSRALEVWEASGRPLSAWQAEHGFRTPRHRAKLVGVRWDTARLAERIAERTRRFLAAGWIGEVEDLVRQGYRDTRPMGSVGYRQVLAHLEGAISERDLPEAIDRATRVFARRQRTWLRDEPVHWIEGV